MRCLVMKLSIIVTTYNQENYIEQAIQGILKQKMNFEYEVLIGEDCSTDNTRQVLKLLEPSLPNCFHIFYREKNLGMNENAEDLLRRTRGDYFTLVEGDDYWIYENKLQNQIDFLDNNPSYLACAHNVEVVDELSHPTGEEYPECKKNVYSIKEFGYGILPGQTGSIVYRNYYVYDIIDTSLLREKSVVGDRKVVYTVACQGDIYCFQKKWGAYRHITNGGSSFSATHKHTKEDELIDIAYGRAMISFAKKLQNKEAVTVAKAGYYKMLFETKYLKIFFEEFLKEDHKVSIVMRICKLIAHNRMRKIKNRIRLKYLK